MNRICGAVVLVFGAFLIWGCTTPVLSPPASVTVAKADFVFEATYNAAGNAYLAAVQTGALTGDRKEQAKALLGRAYGALVLARAAEAAGDATGVAQQSAAVASLASQIMGLLQ